MLQEVKACKID